MSLSEPPPPFRLLAPLLPVSVLAPLLPVMSPVALPMITRFSTFALSVKLPVVWIVSVPSPAFSTTMSPVATTKVSLPVPPVSVSVPAPPSSTSLPVPPMILSLPAWPSIESLPPPPFRLSPVPAISVPTKRSPRSPPCQVTGAVRES